MSAFPPTVAAFCWGKRIDLLAMTSDDVDFGDIAFRLARQKRFAGGTRADAPAYSTAQHSVYVMDLLPPVARPYGLLHDAPEAYCNELTAPAWAALDALAPVPGHVRIAQMALHERVLAPIYAAAGLRWPSAEIQFLVDEADRQAASDEMASLVQIDPTEHGLPRPTKHIIRVHPEDDARSEFLAALAQCGIEWGHP